MKISCLILFITGFLYSQNNGNVQNELVVTNTQIFYFNHNFPHPNGFAKPIEDGAFFFKPYLSYLSNDGLYYSDTTNDRLMDSFILYDSYFYNSFFGDIVKPYKGDYDENLLNNYLDNLFKRTKLPIIKTNSSDNYGYIGNNENSALVYRLSDINANSLLQLEMSINTPLLIDESNWDDIVIGLKYFDGNGDQIPIEGQDFFDLNFKIFIDASDEDVEIDISVPNNSEIASAELFILNYKLGMDSHILIDNVTLKNNGVNLITINDSSFNIVSSDTEWQFIKNYDKNKQFLFKRRIPVLNEIQEAANDLNSTGIVKIIPILPSINIDSLAQNPNFKDEITVKIFNYIDNLTSRFTEWQESEGTDNKLELSGLYFVDEGIKAGREYYLNPILTQVRDSLHSKGLQLFGSPYNDRKTQNCNIESSFDDETISLFDVIWQQPNAFFYEHQHLNTNGVNRDIELLKMANDLAYEKSININIESRMLMNYLGESYGRINDYFDYGEKYGYINYSKLYFDDGGAHYLNAYSDYQKERTDYNNLYKFIKQSRSGKVINGNFEILNNYNNNFFYRWDGNYGSKKNHFSSSSYRNLSFNTNTSNNYYSEKIPIEESQKYFLTFKAKESINDNLYNSALVGIIFYNNNGEKITGLAANDDNNNLNFSDFLDNYYIYFETETDYNDFNLSFIPPSGTVQFQFYLKKWKNANINWKSINFYKEDKIDEARIIYGVQNGNLNVDDVIKHGNYSLKLNKSNHASTTEKISVTNNQYYSFEFFIREKLPILNFNKNNKALIGITTFDSDGNQINTFLENFEYSNALNMNYKYLEGINQVWKKYNIQTKFPENIKSIKIHFYNWYYDNELNLDNFKISLTEENEISRKLDNDNILNQKKWTEKLPLVVSYNKPVFYQDMICVCDTAKLEFSALMRDKDDHLNSNNDLLSIEFYDSNYNLLLSQDIENTSTNLWWSDFFNFWWKGYFDMSSFECLSNEVEDWTQSQWNEFNLFIDIPINVQYIRIGLHQISSNGSVFLITNPKLKVINNRICNTSKEKNLSSNSDNSNIKIFPNPASNKLNIEYDKQVGIKVTYSLHDLNGRKLLTGILNKNNTIDVTSLSEGIYIISIDSGVKYYKKKVLIKK